MDIRFRKHLGVIKKTTRVFDFTTKVTTSQGNQEPWHLSELQATVSLVRNSAAELVSMDGMVTQVEVNACMRKKGPSVIDGPLDYQLIRFLLINYESNLAGWSNYILIRITRIH